MQLHPLDALRDGSSSHVVIDQLAFEDLPELLKAMETSSFQILELVGLDDDILRQVCGHLSVKRPLYLSEVRISKSAFTNEWNLFLDSIENVRFSPSLSL
jgi:hypothetical protein